jgi:hypothetical protein
MDSGTKMGLGRMELEHNTVAAETATRRQLTVEEQLHEDSEARQSRLQRVEERERVEAHVQQIKRSFYCEVRTLDQHWLRMPDQCGCWPMLTLARSSAGLLQAVPVDCRAGGASEQLRPSPPEAVGGPEENGAREDTGETYKERA